MPRQGNRLLNLWQVSIREQPTECADGIQTSQWFRGIPDSSILCSVDGKGQDLRGMQAVSRLSGDHSRAANISFAEPSKTVVPATFDTSRCSSRVERPNCNRQMEVRILPPAPNLTALLTDGVVGRGLITPLLSFPGPKVQIALDKPV